MAKKMVKELHCKMCVEKFQGEHRLMKALIHLKKKHGGLFPEKKMKSEATESNSNDLRSPVVTSTFSPLDVPRTVSTSTQTTNQMISAKKVKTEVDESFAYPVPDGMKVYFRLTDSSFRKRYICNLCGKDLNNLKMCVVHLQQYHHIPLKRDSQNNDLVVSTSRIESACQLVKVKKQTARKSIIQPKTLLVKYSLIRNKAIQQRKLMKNRSECGRNSRKENPRELKRKEKQKNRINVKISSLRRKQNVESAVGSFEDISDVESDPDIYVEPITPSSENDEQAMMIDDVYDRLHCKFDESIPTSSDVIGTVGSTVKEPNDGASEVHESLINLSTNDMKAAVNEIPCTSRIKSPVRIMNDCVSSSDMSSKRESPWNSLSYNSTLVLASNKVGSSGLPLRKHSTEKQEIMKRNSTNDSMKCNITHDGAVVKQEILKSHQVVSSTNNLDDKGSVLNLLSRSSAKISNTANVDDGNPRKTARKTTRPMKPTSSCPSDTRKSINMENVSFLAEFESSRIQSTTDKPCSDDDMRMTQDYVTTSHHRRVPLEGIKKRTGRKTARSRHLY